MDTQKELSKNFIEIVEHYENVITLLPTKIKNSEYKISYFYNKLGMNKQNFYRKMRENKFNLQEVKEILNLLSA